jgi:hypothetical protein
MQSADTTFEQHYSVGELSKCWGYGRETVRKLVKDHPNVLKVRIGKKKINTRYSIPESVARQIHTQLLNPDQPGRRQSEDRATADG